MTTTTATAPVAQAEQTAPASSAPRRGPLLLQVVRTEHLAPSFKRIILGGEALADYPDDAAGAHIKVLVPRPGQERPPLPTLGEGRPRWEVPPGERPFVRTYTIRSVDVAAREVALEFVIHTHGGPAATWAQNATPGDWIAISTPGSPFHFPAHCTWYLFAGDPSALPGIAARLETLPAGAQATVLIEAPSADEAIELPHADRFTVRWLTQDRSASGESPLVEAVRALTIPPDAAIYAAGEAASMTEIRTHVRQTLGIPREQVYVLPYWKQGVNEETYHEQRHHFMDADE